METLLAEARQRGSGGGAPAGFRGGPGGSESLDGLEFLDGLDRLLASIDSEAELTDSGRRAAHRSLDALLATQLRVVALLRAHPAIGSIPIRRPVVVTGMHRTGTTLLQRLLAAQPGLRAPALWEQLAPADPGDRSALMRRAFAYVAEYHRAAPALPAIHFLSPELPDECHRLLAATFRSEIFELRYRVPGYGRWLAEQDLTSAYRYHRTLLRCLLWREPASRVVLKCPFHIGHLDALAAAYPDAVVVRLHRDPGQAVPSGCRLIETIRRARSCRVDPHEIGAFWLTRTAALADQLVATRGAASPAGLTVLDVRYPVLVRDPAAVVAQVCAAAGHPAGPDLPARVAAWLAAHPAGRAGGNRYRAEDYGLDRAALDRRFAAYRRAYDLYPTGG